MTGGEGAGDAPGEAADAGEPEGAPAAPAAAGAEPVRLTVVGPDVFDSLRLAGSGAVIFRE